MSNTEEVYLIHKLKEGDIKALEVLFNLHYSNLCRYLLLLFKNQLLVENIAEDIFVYLWENRETIEIKTSLEAYLYSAGRYKALNQIRNASRHKQINETLAVLEQDEDTSFEKMLELKELEEVLENAIRHLPPRCQEIFRLSREEDLSYKEIAHLLNISVNTVESQMGIALKRLKTVLRP
ncbi:MAG TPA: RNA polymerase sigma-70 factor, partial [Bacteroidales bacterium]|nr:RNA polymerase sigma-70 factor [Bacteroidales bacterium]